MTEAEKAALVEKVARVLWDRQHEHWAMYRKTAEDMGLLIPYDDLSDSKQRELQLEATAAIDLIRAETLEEAAREAECIIAYGTSQAVMRENIAAAIRALKD